METRDRWFLTILIVTCLLCLFNTNCISPAYAQYPLPVYGDPSLGQGFAPGFFGMPQFGGFFPGSFGYNPGYNTGFNPGIVPNFNAGPNPGYNTGFNPGMAPNYNMIPNQGYNAGLNPGMAPNYNMIPNQGYNAGLNMGMAPNYNMIPNQGYNAGLNPGMAPNYNAGFNPGFNMGPNMGMGMAPNYNAGFNPGFNMGPNMGMGMGMGMGMAPNYNAGFNPGFNMGLNMGVNTGFSNPAPGIYVPTPLSMAGGGFAPFGFGAAMPFGAPYGNMAPFGMRTPFGAPFGPNFMRSPMWPNQYGYNQLYNPNYYNPSGGGSSSSGGSTATDTTDIPDVRGNWSGTWESYLTDPNGLVTDPNYHQPIIVKSGSIKLNITSQVTSGGQLYGRVKITGWDVDEYPAWEGEIEEITLTGYIDKSNRWLHAHYYYFEGDKLESDYSNLISDYIWVFDNLKITDTGINGHFRIWGSDSYSVIGKFSVGKYQPQ